MTARELDVLRVMADSHGNKAITVILCISEGTVKIHMNVILRKLDAVDRTQAMTVALRRGILRLE